jgi:hypothetical protein
MWFAPIVIATVAVRHAIAADATHCSGPIHAAHASRDARAVAAKTSALRRSSTVACGEGEVRMESGGMCVGGAAHVRRVLLNFVDNLQHDAIHRQLDFTLFSSHSCFYRLRMHSKKWRTYAALLLV